MSNEDWFKKKFEFFRALAREKTQIRHDLPPFLASLSYWPLFSLFSGATLCFLLSLLFARYPPFYLCPLLFSFAFLSPYSANFGVLSNFLARFSGLALRHLLVAFFGRSVSSYPIFSLFSLKTFSPRTWIRTISSGWQSLNSAGIVVLRVV